MKELIRFACLLVGTVCFLLGSWNLLISVGEIFKKKKELGYIKMPSILIPESILMILAGWLLLSIQYFR
jgi:hypothetical protein